MSAPFRIAVLISGGGTTLKNLIDWDQRGQLNAEIGCVVSSNPEAGGLEYAASAGVVGKIVDHREFDDIDAFSQAIFEPVLESAADLVVMGGFLRRLKIPETFTNRVVNIHPSLIPAFCGKGHYGRRVHQAVLDYGCKLTGCTVHFVDDHYDHGPIIAQQTAPVFDGDDAAALAARVFEVECQLYPQVINAIAGGEITVSGRQVSWKSS